MARPRWSMRKIEEVLRLHFECGRTAREIGRSLGVGRTTVGEYVRRAGEAGLGWPPSEGLGEVELYCPGHLPPPLGNQGLAQEGRVDGLRQVGGFAGRSGLERFGPVPMRDHLTIEFSVGGNKPQACLIRIYDVQGRRVRTLAESPATPGRFRVDWNGQSDSGTLAAAGVYFVRVEIGDHTNTRKVVRLR